MSEGSLDILAVEPYFGGSHRSFLEGLKKHSRHCVTLLSLPARYWKWRMHGGAVTLAGEALAGEAGYDLIFTSDMLNLPNFLSLTRERFGSTPVVVYMHENQATYPMPPYEKRDLTYAYINWASLMAADEVWFNSRFHFDELFAELPRLLKHFPDYQNLESIEEVRAGSRVLEPGCDLAAYDRHVGGKGDIVRVLWNHRWEYDKDPPGFFRVLAEVKQRGGDFQLVLAGQNPRQEPEEFFRAREQFSEELVHFGYIKDFATYARLVWSSHIVVSTAVHEFFGMACVEAMHCRCHPLLPQRLNYPSLVEGDGGASFLYEDEHELAERLLQLIDAPASLQGEEAARLASRFDWSKRAPVFDEEFMRMVRKYNSREIDL